MSRAPEQLLPATVPAYGGDPIAAARSRPLRPGLAHRAAEWGADHELLAVLVLAPVLLAARPAALAWVAMLLVPALWLVVARLHATSAATSFDPPLFWFLVLLPLSLLPVTDWSLAFPKLTGLVLCVALLRAVARVPLAPDWLRRARWIVVAATAAVALIGFLTADWFTNKLFALDALYSALPRVALQHRTREGGIQPNELAGVLVLLAPLAIASALTYSGRRRVKVLLILGTLTALLVLTLTQSRMGYVGAMCGLAVLVLGWLATRGRSALKGLAALAALGMLAGVWLLADRLFSGEAFSGSGTSLDTLPSRIELWDRAIKILQVAPFTGTGPSQFDGVLHGLFPPFVLAPPGWIPHAHNFYLQVMLDQGIPAAVAFFAIVGVALTLLVRLAVDGHRTRLLALGCLGGLVGFLVFGLADTIALGARPGFLLWALLGFAAALWRQHSLNHAEDQAEPALVAEATGGHARR